MKSWKPRETHVNHLIANLTSIAEQAAPSPARAATESRAISLEDAPSPKPIPTAVQDWLAQLRLLYGVPFEYLIADARLLPQESIRFFYIDRNWTDRLVDGALSIGTNFSQDNLHANLFYESIQHQLDTKETQLRSQLRNKPAPKFASESGTLTGFLFRSTVVSGWPGLEVEATSNSQILQLLRMDRLSDNVLLCIFNGVPDSVEIREPSEGLHFGVRANETQPVTYDVILRSLGTGNDAPSQAGIQIDPPLTAPAQFRTGNNQPEGVLKIGDLANNITSVLKQNHHLNANDSLTSAGFAIQMVRAAGAQFFTLGATL